jgi:hypothetical protein
MEKEEEKRRRLGKKKKRLRISIPSQMYNAEKTREPMVSKMHILAGCQIHFLETTWPTIKCSLLSMLVVTNFAWIKLI